MTSPRVGQAPVRALISFRTSSPEAFEVLRKRLSSVDVEIVIRLAAEHELEDNSGGLIGVLPSFAVPDQWWRIGVSAAGAEAFSRFERGPEFGRVKSAMVTMQNRHDFTGTFRLLDREIEVRRVLLRVFSLVIERKPEVAIFDVVPHDYVSVGIEEVLKWLEIPVLFFQPSLVGPQSLPAKSVVDPYPYSISPWIREEFKEELSEVVQLAKSAILRLEGGKGTPKVATHRRKEADALTFRGRLRAARFTILRMVSGLHYPSVNLSSHLNLPAWFKRPLEVVLDWSLRRSLRFAIFSIPSERRETKGRFALFALHYEPERTSLPEGYPFTSQIDAVIRARALLPRDIVLLVKEHFAQSAAALRGTLGRSPATYKMLEEIPGIVLVGIGARTPELLQSAECVFTMTGKIGIEAALKGTPVVFGGQPWWREIPGGAALTSFRDSEELSGFLEAQHPSRDEVFDWLSNQFQSMLVPVLGDATVERYSARISPLPARFGELQLEVLVDVIGTFVASEVRGANQYG